MIQYCTIYLAAWYYWSFKEDNSSKFKHSNIEEGRIFLKRFLNIIECEYLESGEISIIFDSNINKINQGYLSVNTSEDIVILKSSYKKTSQNKHEILINDYHGSDSYIKKLENSDDPLQLEPIDVQLIYKINEENVVSNKLKLISKRKSSAWVGYDDTDYR